MIKKNDYFVINFKSQDCCKMSDQKCTGCGEYIVRCQSFRIVNVSCDGVHRVSHFRIVNIYKFIINQVVHKVKINAHQITCRKRRVENIIRKKTPVPRCLLDIINSYL